LIRFVYSQKLAAHPTVYLGNPARLPDCHTTYGLSLSHPTAQSTTNMLQTKKRRSGVPQYIEPHSLMGGGLDALDALLPGFEAALKNAGGSVFDAGTDFRLYDHGDSFVRGESCVRMVVASRKLVNETLVKHLTATAGDRLTIKTGVKVTDLMWGPGFDKITGVKLSSGEDVAADLVIVADGRRSNLPQWLKAGGAGEPHTKRVDSKVVYGVRWMQLPDDYDWDKVYGYTMHRHEPNARP
jgi:2-polyprenyl-6-methoxyphenol hydroxylase-like FAD-dependent oxidoreductase